ncbi:hypothetical protein Q1695_005712 [Nippostrongylus brasiliensis]|nr:hypothetical protein Q1695_005712 [Nippostrongylus brasiliensis]
MADSFLSCDNMKIHPAKESKKEPQPMIVLSTEALATDDSYRFRRLKPPMPKLCCVLPVNAVAIFGVASTSILSVAIYVYCLIHLLQSEYGGPKVIAVLTVALVIVLLFAGLFVWGMFATRDRLLLPFTTFSCFLLFAVVGTLIATIVTSPDEFSAAMSKADNVAGASVADLVIFRVVLGVATLVLAIELYAYIRLFLHVRAVKRSLRR